MNKEYIFNDNKYIIFKGEVDLFDYDTLKELFTSYFDNYDYVLIDEAYNKVRLKGFCDNGSKMHNKYNSIDMLDDYITNYCAYNCRWVLLKKVK